MKVKIKSKTNVDNTRPKTVVANRQNNTIIRRMLGIILMDIKIRVFGATSAKPEEWEAYRRFEELARGGKVK